MRPSSTAVPSLEADTELLVAAVIHTVAPGEAACLSHPGLTVAMQLGPSPIDLHLECQSRQYDSRYVPGDLTCIPPGAAHGYRHRVHTAVAHLSIDTGFVDQTFEGHVPDIVYETRFRFQDGLIEHVMRAVGSGGSRLFQESAAVLVLERLALRPRDNISLGCASRVRRATEYMHANLDKPISLVELSYLSGLSPSHFQRVFKATTRQSPHQYLMEIRLQASKDLLADPARSIADVSLLVGFSSQTHFTSAFHRQFGITPAAFKKSGHGTGESLAGNLTKGTFLKDTAPA
jgi:AraC family transcriptional regulator